MKPPGRVVFPHKLLKPALIYRRYSAPHKLKLFFININARNVIAFVGKAHARNKADIAGSRNSNFHFCSPSAFRISSIYASTTIRRSNSFSTFLREFSPIAFLSSYGSAINRSSLFIRSSVSRSFIR